jgi:cell division septum initiation protein DivIVA
MRISALAFLLLLAACASDRIAADAQAQLDAIAAGYRSARTVELDRCQAASQPCYAARRAGYEAEAAYASADQERSPGSIMWARHATIDFEMAVKDLP